MQKIVSEEVYQMIEANYGDLLDSPESVRQERAEPCSR